MKLTGLTTAPRPPLWVSKCRCGPVTLPVVPMSPMRCPAETLALSETR